MRDYARPLSEHENYALLWELDHHPVGFSSLDRIVFGAHAFMHLHIVDEPHRRRCLGTEFVKKSADIYFQVFDLERLYSEPNALNVAPNRTLQRAGYTYLFSHETSPGPINFRQVTTRWVLELPDGATHCPNRCRSRGRAGSPSTDLSSIQVALCSHRKNRVPRLVPHP